MSVKNPVIEKIGPKGPKMSRFGPKSSFSSFDENLSHWCVLFGPPKGWSYELMLVCPLVRLFVSDRKLEELALRIFLILCMKLGDYMGRKVKETVFWEMTPLARFWAKKTVSKWSKWSFWTWMTCQFKVKSYNTHTHTHRHTSITQNVNVIIKHRDSC